MGSFGQWWTGVSKGKVCRFTYVCGTERILVDEVIHTIRSTLSLPAHECTYLTAGQTPEREVWEVCATYPGLGRRLIVVRHAERLRSWQTLHDMIDAGRELTGLYVVFDSSDTGLQSDGQLPPHLAALRDSSAGQLVKCSTPSEDDLLAWVTRKLPGSGKMMASYILQRAGGDLVTTAAVCAKAALFGDQVNESIIDDLCQEQSADDFADSLVSLRRRHALLCIERMDDREMSMALGLLEIRLETLAALNKALRQRMPEREMVMKLQLHPFLIKKFKDVAGSYDPDRVSSCRRTLAIAQGAWNGGAHEGVAEVLVALW